MKHFGIFLLSFFSLSFVACNAQETPHEGPITVYVDEVKKHIGDDNVIILDVRTPREVAEGIIEGAVHININDIDFATQAGALNKMKPIYVYCKAGGRSAKAQRTLLDLGFQTVYNVEGGITEWIKKGYEVKK